MAKFDFAALGRLQAKLAVLAHPDPTPLLLQWREIIKQDNRRGILAGLDKDGKPMPPVTYRPKGSPLHWGARKQAAKVAASATPAHNNLTSTQYRHLSGPPLAPRGVNSRVITNLLTQHGYDSSRGVYFAEGAWREVVSTKGVYFLPYHFAGSGNLPKRDLTGIRPWGRQQLVAALQKWGRDLLREHWG
jgi:hypothetical protein